MKFQVLVTERAERELNEATDYIAKEAPGAAQRWHDGFIACLHSLAVNPTRCSKARENDRFPFDLYQLLFGQRNSYRAVFTVRDDTVAILSIRHTARRDLRPSDFVNDG
jgi:plasmid stabilization system protein ParE